MFSKLCHSCIVKKKRKKKKKNIMCKPGCVYSYVFPPLLHRKYVHFSVKNLKKKSK